MSSFDNTRLPDWALAREGYSFFRRKRYQEAAVLLEKSYHHINSPEPLILLVVSYLHTDRFLQAEGMLSQLRRSYPSSPASAQIEGYLYLKSASSTEAAIIKYVELTSRYPSNRYLRLVLKRLEAAKDFRIFQRNIRIEQCVEIPSLSTPLSFSLPKIRFPFRLRKKVTRPRASFSIPRVPVAVAAVCAALGCVYYFADLGDFISEKMLKYRYGHRSEETDYAVLDDSRYPLVDTVLREKPLYYFHNDEELRKEYDETRGMIKQRKYNQSIYRLNRIVKSNANIRVKDKALYLLKFIGSVEDRDERGIPYQKIAAEPEFYPGATVEWKGKIENLKTRDGKSSFSLLIRSEDDTIAGVAEIFYPEKKELENGLKVTVKGIFVNVIGKEKRPYVNAEDVN